jgi:hypothetical protein
MARKSLQERLEALEQKERQLAVRKEALEAQVKQVARKQRTRTLIQVGGVMATLGIETVVEAEQLKRYASQQKGWWDQWQSST